MARTVKFSLIFPVGLYLRGEDLQFSYRQAATQKEMRFHLRLKDKHYDLLEIVNGNTVAFPEAKIGQSIEGTDLSYEDLAMRFLYWPNARVRKQEHYKVGAHVQCAGDTFRNLGLLLERVKAFQRP